MPLDWLYRPTPRSPASPGSRRWAWTSARACPSASSSPATCTSIWRTCSCTGPHAACRCRPRRRRRRARRRVRRVLRAARVIDAIKVGDWLLRHGHLDWSSCTPSASTSGGAPGPRRRSGCWPGSTATPGRCASPRSARSSSSPACRLPESNVGAVAADDPTRIGDLVYRQWGVDRRVRRRAPSARPRAVPQGHRPLRLHAPRGRAVRPGHQGEARPPAGWCIEVHDALVARGYDGPRPEFGERWRQLFARLSDVVAAQRRCVRVGSETLRPTTHAPRPAAKPTLTHRRPAANRPSLTATRQNLR